jgi:glycosidase
MWGANDPDDRKPMLWPDISYEDEVYLPDGNTRNPDKVEINQDLRAYYKALIALRHQYQALKTGEFHQILADDERKLYGFSRSQMKQGKMQRLKVYLNADELEHAVTVGKQDRVVFPEYLQIKNGKVSLPANTGVVLLVE